MNTDQLTTIARPYAAAVFAEAIQHKNMSAWRKLLDVACMITQDSAVQALLLQPGIRPNQLADFYCDLLSGLLNDEQKNFIHLLANNRRLSALPEIAMLFRLRQEEFEKILTVNVRSAIPLSEAWRARLSDKLSNKLQRKIELDCAIDDTLIAGVIVAAGDRVMDGSVRGKLERLSEEVLG